MIVFVALVLLGLWSLALFLGTAAGGLIHALFLVAAFLIMFRLLQRSAHRGGPL